MENGSEFRFVANEWHGGQFSALYAFSSTGTVQETLSCEIRSCIKIAERTLEKSSDGEDVDARLLQVSEDIDILKEFLEYAELAEAKKFPPQD